ncbi:hypothetical protein GUJ93_ZPchr0005g15618 [Zizania palustris]|uniref:Uncharacterized protein n=1 Tax=Zizania palustris TaxID=103762 RepID=A0A8J5SBU5_ZIZPA|nr:hypothetical protein GUJ93_ZPchr0005g15618 [Zizania palustris]
MAQLCATEDKARAALPDAQIIHAAEEVNTSIDFSAVVNLNEEHARVKLKAVDLGRWRSTSTSITRHARYPCLAAYSGLAGLAGLTGHVGRIYLTGHASYVGFTELIFTEGGRCRVLLATLEPHAGVAR